MNRIGSAARDIIGENLPIGIIPVILADITFHQASPLATADAIAQVRKNAELLTRIAMIPLIFSGDIDIYFNAMCQMSCSGKS